MSQQLMQCYRNVRCILNDGHLGECELTPRTYTQSEWDAREREWQAKGGAAYLAAANNVRVMANPGMTSGVSNGQTVGDAAYALAEIIESLTPADAATALEAIVKERVEAAVAPLRAELIESESVRSELIERIQELEQRFDSAYEKTLPSPCGVSGHRMVDWVEGHKHVPDCWRGRTTMPNSYRNYPTCGLEETGFHCLRCDEVKAARSEGYSNAMNVAIRNLELWPDSSLCESPKFLAALTRVTNVYREVEAAVAPLRAEIQRLNGLLLNSGCPLGEQKCIRVVGL